MTDPIFLKILELSDITIFEQLQIEEALMRGDDQNWCILNHGVADSIVMGISGKLEKLINPSLIQSKPVPVIKRFSGGGTVIVDQNTCFVTFIFNQKSLNIPLFPQPIMKWTEDFYRPLFNDPSFALCENDYVFGQKKFGGNAQYIQRNRWLHHTSFLWDYDPQKMEYLLLPEKRPNYRQNRSHLDFLCRLKDYFPTKEGFFLQLKQRLSELFILQHSNEEISSYLRRPHRKSTESIIT